MEAFTFQDHNAFLVDCSTFLQSSYNVMESSSSSLQIHQHSVQKKRETSDGNSASSKIKERKGRAVNKARDGEKKDKKLIIEGEVPEGFIRVRARRGQATDRHSLAERLRRDKISSRMKTLEGLVPGCEKVTGKASMLDEIINYVQSLQNQVEFLSMKLAIVSPSTWHDYGLNLYGHTDQKQGVFLSNVLPYSLMESSSIPPTHIPGDISYSQEEGILLTNMGDHRQVNDIFLNHACSS